MIFFLLFPFRLKNVAGLTRHAKGCFGERHAFPAPEELLVAIVEVYVEGYGSVLHPVRAAPFPAMDEQHAAFEGFSMHEALFNALAVLHDLDGLDAGKGGDLA